MIKKIAITGGIGSGKSTALKYLQSLGYSVLSCDELYKDIIQDPSYIRQIENSFPTAIVDGNINRETLSKIIFMHPEKRALINSISHPIIMEKLNEEMKKCTATLVFAEVPLLFEGNYENLFDYVIVIIRDKEERINAVQARDGSNRESIQMRIASQFDYDSTEGQMRMSAANTYILKNNFDLQSLHNQLLSILYNILQL